jgi:serine/threonine protein kinase
LTGRVAGPAPIVREDGTIFLPPGSFFNDKYLITEVLGEGGMSVVYKARHAVMKNIVAIKMLKGTYASNSRAVLRFQREGQTVSRLSHAHIARVFEFGLSREGQPFLAREYLEGKALSALIGQYGPLPLDKALTIFSQVVDALASSHAAGFIHRDLKPSNVFVLNPGATQPQVKIVDFGLADVFDEEEDGQKKVNLEVEIFGSPLHMSPEQCLGKQLDDRTDIYSMGCLMYEGLTGVPPLEGGDMLETMQMQVEETPRTFRKVAPDRNDLALIEPIVFKCLAKDPGSRYQTMAQLSRALTEVEAAGQAGTAGSAAVDNTEALAFEERERVKGLIIQRVLIAVLVVIVLIPVLGIVLFKNSEVEAKLNNPGDKASFAMDRGQYQDAQKQFQTMLDQARHADQKADLVRLLGDQAVLEHVLADKTGESKDDHEIGDINEATGNQLLLDMGTSQAINVLLDGDKPADELEKALSEPVQKMVLVTQGLTWQQQYAPAKEAMALLIDKLSRKLGASSPLVVNTKLRYASMLLQQIINPASPLTPREKQELVGEPKALLDTPLSMDSGGDLWLARSNLALAQALTGSVDEAKKLRDDVIAGYASAAPAADKSAQIEAVIEARLGDIDVALNDPKAALPMYKSAYHRFLADKTYPQAAYCISAFSRSFWLSGQLKDGYDFLTTELAKPEVVAPEGTAVRAELQAWLGQLQFWMATVDASTLKRFFADNSAIKKSNGELRHQAERMALESWLFVQNSRPCALWLATPALDTLAKVYFEGNTIGRAVPLLRLKLAVAERTNNARAADEARSHLGVALLGYSKTPLAQAYTLYDHSQILLASSDPILEARALYDASSKPITAGGESAILWLDQWIPQLAAKFIEHEADKIVLLTGCNKSCDNIGDLYGKSSLEYFSQLRWQGHLAWRLARGAEAKKSLLDARDVALANAELPLLDRLNMYGDLILVCQGTNDKEGVKKYTSEMNALTTH